MISLVLLKSICLTLCFVPKDVDVNDDQMEFDANTSSIEAIANAFPVLDSCQDR